MSVPPTHMLTRAATSQRARPQEGRSISLHQDHRPPLACNQRNERSERRPERPSGCLPLQNSDLASYEVGDGVSGA